MSAYISLLRGINVGGSKILSMEALCNIYAGLGYTHVRTYLQSGNVIFQSPQADPARLVRQIEPQIERTCGFHVEVFIRRPQDFKRLIDDNPFLSLVSQDTGMLHVTFLYQAASEEAWSKLSIPDNIPDKMARAEKAIYLYYPNGYAKAKISTSYLEKTLGVSMTNRNWNTVNALYKLAVEIQDGD